MMLYVCPSKAVACDSTLPKNFYEKVNVLYFFRFSLLNFFIRNSNVDERINVSLIE